MSTESTITGEWAYWISHPECVTSAYVETIEDPPTPEIQQWLHIVFDVSTGAGRLRSGVRSYPASAFQRDASPVRPIGRASI